MAGVSWAQSGVAGDLVSKRLVINELVAYLDLAALPAALLIDCDPAQQSQPATLIDSAFTMVLHVAQVDLSL